MVSTDHPKLMPVAPDYQEVPCATAIIMAAMISFHSARPDPAPVPMRMSVSLVRGSRPLAIRAVNGICNMERFMRLTTGAGEC